MTAKLLKQSLTEIPDDAEVILSIGNSSGSVEDFEYDEDENALVLRGEEE